MSVLIRMMGAVVSLVMACLGGSAAAEGHVWSPDGPIRMIVAFTAGGGADTQARLIAEDLETREGWEVIPEQVIGKGGLNALIALRDMPADGTAIAMIVTETLGYNAAADRRAGLDPDDFTPLTTTAGFQMGIVAKADRGWTDLGDVIAAARAGEAIRFAVMGDKLADLAFVIGEANGVAFNIVSLQGGRAVLNGLTAGDVDVGFVAGAQASGVAAGDLVNLASALSRPLAQTPDAPLIGEFNTPFVADGYFAFVAPGDLPEEARTALTRAIVEATETGAAAGFIDQAFGGNVNITGAELETVLQESYDQAKDLMEAAQ